MRNILLKISLLLSIILSCAMGNCGYAQANPTVKVVPMGNNQCLIYDRQVAVIGAKACRGNTVTYEAIGNNITQYRWTVTGGTYTLSAGQDRCTVTWGNGDMGIVEVEATAATGSICSDRLVVTLEDKPVCRSITRPAYITNPPNYSEKVIYVCLGDSLVFIDNSISTTTPIVGYYWHTPWGTSGNATYSFVAQALGSYDVEHRVYNECGCYDEETIKLVVGESCPLTLGCYGTVCANSSVDYTATSPNCNMYYWDVEGGLLLSGQGSQSITVVWGAPESGYGILTLDGAHCSCDCQSPKSIKVPVISDAVIIKGKDTVCNDKKEVYSLPLWGGTAYEWNVSPTTGTYIISGDSTNELALRFTANGTYTITAKYRCAFLDCGPYTVSKTVYVKDELAITSPPNDVVCLGESVTFATNATTGSRWSISKGGNTVFESSTPSATLTHIFPDEGVYTIRAENDDYCNRAMKVVEVPRRPPSITNVNGPREVCPGYAQYYSTTPTSPDYIIEWTWDNGGTDSATCTGDNVMITFGNPVSDISVRQVDRRTGCKSAALLIGITPFSFDPWPYAGSLIKVCQGQTFELDRLEPHEATVLYEWTVEPAYAASVVGDHLQPNVTVLANYSYNLPETVAMVLKRKACGVERYDTAWVYVGEIETPGIEARTYCAHIEDLLRMDATSDWENADSTHSYWDVTDGTTTFRVDGLPGNVVFPSAGTYQVTLHYVAKQGCTATCSTQVTVYAFPYVYLQEIGGSICLQIELGWPPNDLPHTVWSTGHIDQLSVPTPASGPVSCSVSYGNCSLDLIWNPMTQTTCTPSPSAFTAAWLCYNIYEIQTGPVVTWPATLQFLCGTTVVAMTQLTMPNQHVLVPQPCVDMLRLTWGDGGVTYCDEYTITPASGNLLDFSVASDCYGHIVVTDNTSYPPPPFAMPQRTVEAIQSGHTTGTQAAFPSDGTMAKVLVLGSLTGPAKFRVKIYVGTNPNCYVDYENIFDPLPHIVSPGFPQPLCENTPALFSADATGCKLEYRWDFGDGSYNFGNGIYHSYGQEGLCSPSLTVTDCHGCVVSRSATPPIDVNRNPITNRVIAGNSPDCYGDEMRLEYREVHSIPLHTNGTYLWTPGSCTTAIATVYAGGDYVVQENIVPLGCRGETEGNAKYPNEIIAQIRCQNSYCEGDEVTAMGYAGDQYQYTWELYDQYNTLVGSSAEANYTFTPPAAGNYWLLLTVGENSCSVSCSTQFTVHPQPAAPSIVFGSNACIDQGPVQLESVGNTPLLWSNGDIGATATYYIPGPVEAYYVDGYGCQSHTASTVIPYPPNFDGLLTGCYNICPDDNPYLSVYTLGAEVGSPWEWRWNGILKSSGYVLLPPLTITLPLPGPGDYQLEVTDYGNGCSAQSPILTLNTLNCENAGGGSGTGAGGRVLSCTPTIKSCVAEGCIVKYTAQVTVCNRSSSPVTVASIGSSTSLTVATVLPHILLPDECMTIDFSFYYDFTTPAAALFSINDLAGMELGHFALSLADCIECLNPDMCDFEIKLNMNLNNTYSILDQTIYFNLTFTLPGPNVQVLAVWCDGVGEMVSGPGTNPYQGLFSISFGQLTQLVESGEPLCFYVLCCVDDEKPCLHQICLQAEEVEDLFHEVVQALSSHNEKGSGKAYGDGVRQHYRLVPNPTMGKVCVVEESTGVPATDVSEVEVLSLTGQTLLRHKGGGWIDLSSLPTGSYMVRVYGARENATHKLVVKRP